MGRATEVVLYRLRYLIEFMVVHQDAELMRGTGVLRLAEKWRWSNFLPRCYCEVHHQSTLHCQKPVVRPSLQPVKATLVVFRRSLAVEKGAIQV